MRGTCVVFLGGGRPVKMRNTWFWGKERPVKMRNTCVDFWGEAGGPEGQIYEKPVVE